ncbi:helix-hairpin-helix domain-containing protein [Catenulispora pinisilvae]|uniref:helix-hairpin-helix domain-containing protein n=1 Tax=Catenulispora pinisilvae TaxID=2705253 RepID=UPI001E60E3B4|nr:helix-hairpin-helix domain-containing protein [Catenulispora pinisilvae]
MKAAAGRIDAGLTDAAVVAGAARTVGRVDAEAADGVVARAAGTSGSIDAGSADGVVARAVQPIGSLDARPAHAVVARAARTAGSLDAEPAHAAALALAARATGLIDAGLADAVVASSASLAPAAGRIDVEPPEPALALLVAPIARELRALAAHHYATDASRRQSCPPHAAMSTNPALAGPASAGASSAGAASGSAVVIDVEGKVAHPGVETLPAGSRVYEALAAAGGALPGVDVTALDLARPVTDGEQLRVGIEGVPGPVVGLPQPSGGKSARGKRGRPAAPVNLNTATLEQLEAVPDVGPALAQRILDWRSEHGRFGSVAQLRQVRGIGDRKFSDMHDSVTV